MRTGLDAGFHPYLETLEDRTVLATVQGGGDSLTMAVVTEAYPMPPGVHQPGVVAPEPFPIDPTAIFTVVVQRHH